jgi:hypothetical protein
VARQGFATQLWQVIQRPNNLQTPAAGNQSVQRTQATQDRQQVDHRCYNCGENGYYANQYPNSWTYANQPAIATPTPTRGVNSIPITAKQNYARGRVNHVPDVVIGVFLINDIFAVVLFDSEASHSFISAAYVGNIICP